MTVDVYTPVELLADTDLGTIIPMDRFTLALGRTDTQTARVRRALLQVLRSASRDIEDATRRFWVPTLQTVRYDVPPSSNLNLAANEFLPLTGGQAIILTLYGTVRTVGTDYKLIPNEEGTAIGHIERLISGIVVEWGMGGDSTNYRQQIVVSGVRAAAPYVPDDVAMATEIWSVIRWHQYENDYLSGAGGSEELGYSMPTEHLVIADLLGRHTRFEAPQTMRTGSD